MKKKYFRSIKVDYIANVSNSYAGAILLVDF